jgi:hypothetical protein
MKALLENAIVLEERENYGINFHSRLIISAHIVWVVREERVWGGRRKKGAKTQYVSTFISKAERSLRF